MLLMFLGNAGIITTISSVVFSFISIGREGLFSFEVLVLISGLLLLLFLSRSNWVDQKLSILINKALNRYTDLEVKDYYSLLNLEEDYRVQELKVSRNDWLKNKCLDELELDDEGVTVLGIRRKDGEFLGVPEGSTEVGENDILILYGRERVLDSLKNRKKGSLGEKEHKEKKKEQEEVEEVEEEEKKRKNKTISLLLHRVPGVFSTRQYVAAFVPGDG